MNNSTVGVHGFGLFTANSELIYDETFKFKGLILSHTTQLESMVGFESTEILFGASDSIRKVSQRIYKWSVHAEHLNRDFITDGEKRQMLLTILEGTKALRSMDWNYARLSDPSEILHGAPSPLAILTVMGKGLDTMQAELRRMKRE